MESREKTCLFVFVRLPLVSAEVVFARISKKRKNARSNKTKELGGGGEIIELI